MNTPAPAARRRAWLLGALLGGLLPPARADVRRGRVLTFPRDHGAHLDARTEWWYATGWLDGEAAPSHGFQVTFFRSATGLAAAVDSRFAARHLLFAHVALTDLAAGRNHHAQRILRWDGRSAGGAGFAAEQDTRVVVGPWRIERDDASGFSRYRTQFTLDGELPLALAIEMTAAAPPLLQGDAGFSRKGPDERHASHYVSEPQLVVRAALERRGAPPLVLPGRAWIDHEWSDELLAEGAVGWDWAGINLIDGSALTAFRLRRADGSVLWAGGSWRDRGGSTRSYAPAEVAFSAGRRWRSPRSGASYPVQWQLALPQGRFALRALLDAQELDSRASSGALYWEGLSELLDERGARVGLGYLEMTGYAGPIRLG